ncbi:hypothetical protein DOTSEDRAFT_28797 [Dothistroma septosporum NZE10]|uniref:Uncharacterized protein n=1 Tax=Dothistroma septosporum (strain NZE10 / CBS 128990) TaxID=675120 RepID=M2YL41_DOTSN|nr:hypothetical protein DOTSEDRAFT_28797 [Dothistroma septosporum NZE10]
MSDVIVTDTISDEALFLPIPQSNMVAERKPGSSGPLKRMTPDQKSPRKQIKLDVECDVHTDTGPPATSIRLEPVDTILYYLSNDRALPTSDRDRVAQNFEVDRLGHLADQEIRYHAHQYGAEIHKSWQHNSIMEHKHRLKLLDEDTAIVALLRQIAELQTPFSS